jgi:hypothetical protein
LRFGVKATGLEFRFQVSWCRVQGVGIRVGGLGFGIWSSGLMVEGSWCRVQDVGIRVEGLGSGVWGLRFEV